jgi:hypothetical protein
VTAASTTAAAAALPRPRLWGVGRYEAGDQLIYFDISREDWQRDTAWARDVLAGHGIGRGSGLLMVGGLPESPWFDPFETAARELGVPFSVGEIFVFDAFRTGMYARRLPVTMVFGINRVVAEGLGDDLAELAARVPVIVARPDAAGLLAEAGARPYIVTRVGPAIAVECPQRAGAHVNGAEWTLAEHGGELFISTAGPRAHQVTDAPTGLSGTVTGGACGCGRSGQRISVTG